jgi:hypothetical protein
MLFVLFLLRGTPTQTATAKGLYKTLRAIWGLLWLYNMTLVKST